MQSIKRAIRSFLDDRFDMEAVRAFVHKQMRKRLPPHTGWWHVFGSLSLMLFINQVVTGILLLLYYRPTPEEAFKSVQYLHADVSFGWLFRQLHAWGATLMIVAVLVHMARTFFMGAYKKPRELTWVVGVFIAIVTITFGFSGYLLPWSQLSYWATTVGTEIAGAIPVVGPPLRTVMLGGHNVGRETLSRFFTLHAVVLPWLMVFLVVVHLAMMRAQNLATLEPVGQERPYPPESGIPFWPVHLAKEGCVALATLGLLVTLSVLAPWEIGEPADPLSTPEGIKPEWYFLPSYQLLKYFTGHGGKVLGILAAGVPFVLLFLWPFLDRSKPRHPKRRPVAVTVGSLAIVLAVGMGLVGHLSETRRTIFGTTIEFDILGRPRVIGADARRPGAEPTSHPRDDLSSAVIDQSAD
jgi:quinol-cytochrome oxidoreductase complex cytochrome b subunit